MSEKEKREMAEMVETARYLAENDPYALMIAKSNIDILKVRCEMDKMAAGRPAV